MIKLGYALSSEEHGPQELVRFAARAEETGFSFAMVSDHFHPWIDRQGHSPFVWSVIGGIAQVTESMRVGTGVTCPIKRMHPVVVAHAAATAAAMLPGRFFLGVGTGENLNEHVTGTAWPRLAVRQEMLEEAVEIMRLLWKGGFHSFDGRFFKVDRARLYTLPDDPIPVYVAAGGPDAAELAGRIGDGLISTRADPKITGSFIRSGGEAMPRFGQIHACWHTDARKARELALEIWPISNLPGSLKADLPSPRHFEQASELVRGSDIEEKLVIGPDAGRYLEAIRRFAEAGYDHVYFHQVGPDQEGFFRFYESEVRPHVGRIPVAEPATAVAS